MEPWKEFFNKAPDAANFSPERKSPEDLRLESYARFLDLITTDVKDEVWGEAWRNWLTGEHTESPMPVQGNPPQGFKEFIEGKGYSFETGERLHN